MDLPLLSFSVIVFEFEFSVSLSLSLCLCLSHFHLSLTAVGFYLIQTSSTTPQRQTFQRRYLINRWAQLAAPQKRRAVAKHLATLDTAGFAMDKYTSTHLEQAVTVQAHRICCAPQIYSTICTNSQGTKYNSDLSSVMICIRICIIISLNAFLKLL